MVNLYFGHRYIYLVKSVLYFRRYNEDQVPTFYLHLFSLKSIPPNPPFHFLVLEDASFLYTILILSRFELKTYLNHSSPLYRLSQVTGVHQHQLLLPYSRPSYSRLFIVLRLEHSMDFKLQWRIFILVELCK